VAAKIWIDVEDLFLYAAASDRPSGIQRLALEIQRALVARWGTGGPVRFLRYDVQRAAFAEVPWTDVLGLYTGMAATAAIRTPVRAGSAQAVESGGLRRLARRLVDRLPRRARAPLVQAVRLQVQALGSAARGVVALARSLVARPVTTVPPDGAARFKAEVAPGDVLLVLGMRWEQKDYAGLVARTRAQYRVRFALLIYDLIPVRCPEWCHTVMATGFARWINDLLPLTDELLTISRASARDIEAYAAERGIALPGPIHTILIGTGFSDMVLAPAAANAALPSPGSYVLFVSTIEARKNHALLLRAWRRLLAEMPPEQVPRLVFVGRIGVLVVDLLQQLDNSNYLNGRVVIIESPSDTDLAALYQGCLFTVFPSLFEGWGLPVSESLSFGKPCVIANTTSLPEAGGDFARYFDPDNLNDAVRVLRAVLEDRDGLAAWEAKIRREFRPTSWSASANTVVAAVLPELLHDES